MAIRTYGHNNVDWEQRVDMDRLRTDRLTRLKTALNNSELGALLTFDFHNIRYMTSTHIGTWAMDKLIRFALLPRGGEPVIWDFGSAAPTPPALQPLARLQPYPHRHRPPPQSQRRTRITGRAEHPSRRNQPQSRVGGGPGPKDQTRAGSARPRR